MTLRIVAELQPAALANLSDTTWDPTVSPEIKCSSMIADSTAWRRESGAGRPDFWGLVRLTIGFIPDYVPALQCAARTWSV